MCYGNTTFVLSLIAFAMGVKLLLKTKKYASLGVSFERICSFVIIFLAALVLLFSGYHSVRKLTNCWSGQRPCMMQNMRHMQQPMMMQNQKMQPMMQQNKMPMHKNMMMQPMSSGKK